MALSFSGQLAAMIADVRAMGPDSKRAMTKTMKTSAASILADAKRRSSWSKRIPKSLTSRVITRKGNPGVAVASRTSVAPHARPYEFGKSGKGAKSHFRAPLFGNRERWYSHSTRPFIVPAARKGTEQFRNDVEKAVVIAYRKAGFK